MSIEARLKALEDRAEIAELIARYGPIVDSGEGQHLDDLWADDGKYLVGDECSMRREDIPHLTELPGHQDYLAAGCAHMLTPPTITVTGDTAEAVHHSMVLMREGDRWIADRVSANRWRFIRTEQGWRVKVRQNFLLDGDARARALLAPGGSITFPEADSASALGAR